MLNERFKNDGKITYSLNKIQSQFKKKLQEKIRTQHYSFEKVSCVICNSITFELLSEKDRYGLYMPVGICKQCGLVQTNPRMKQSNYNEFYNDEYRKIYGEKEFPTHNFFKNEYTKGKVIFKFIKQITGKETTSKFVVEIGAGTGGILKFFQDKGNEVFGLDIGSEYIEFGKQYGLDLKVGTVESLSLKKKPDLVILSHVLEHLFNPVKELQTLRKFLHDKSLVYIEVPGIKHLDLTYNQNFLEYLQNAHLYHFSLNSLCNCTKKAGYELVGGNEIISTLFKIGKVDNNYKNDYESTLKFLQRLEKIRSSSLNLSKIRAKIFAAIYRLLLITGTRHFVQPLYYKYKTTKD